MRLCVICPTFQPSKIPCGVGDYTTILVNHISKLHKLEITVISSKHYTGEKNDCIITNYELNKTLGIIKLFFFLYKQRFDILLIEYSPPLYDKFLFIINLVPLLRLFTKTKIIFSFHTLYGNFLSKLMLIPALIFSCHLISTNEEIDAIFEKRLRFFKYKLSSIPIGSNIFPLTMNLSIGDLGKSLGLKENILTLIYFGFYYPGKDIDIFIKALKILKEKGLDFQCIFAGSKWPYTPQYYDEMKKLCTLLNLDSHCIWTGYLPPEKVALYLSIADISVNPSSAGLTSRNGSVMASVVFNIPIIGTNVKTSKYFIDNKTCLLFEARNCVELASCIIKLSQNKELYNTIKSNLKELSNIFDWDKIAEEHCKLFE
ncbi:MAG: glycosyltransferase [Candidatus Hydrogenedentota bacterium]